MAFLPCGAAVFRGKPESGSELQVLVGLLGEDVGDFAVEGEVDDVADVVVALHLDGGDDDDDVAALGIDMQMHGGAHHLSDLDAGGDALVGDIGMFGADAQRDRLALDVVSQQAGFLLGGKLDLDAADLDEVLLVLALELGVKEVHDGHY